MSLAHAATLLFSVAPRCPQQMACSQHVRIWLFWRATDLVIIGNPQSSCFVSSGQSEGLAELSLLSAAVLAVWPSPCVRVVDSLIIIIIIILIIIIIKKLNT